MRRSPATCRCRYSQRAAAHPQGTTRGAIIVWFFPLGCWTAAHELPSTVAGDGEDRPGGRWRPDGALFGGCARVGRSVEGPLAKALALANLDPMIRLIEPLVRPLLVCLLGPRTAMR
jgi:hypothetical protein